MVARRTDAGVRQKHRRPDMTSGILSLAGDRRPRAIRPDALQRGVSGFSPDGRWLAYASNESGQSEVYVQPYPGPGPRQQVSTDGGTAPAWARDARELFYHDHTISWRAGDSHQDDGRGGRLQPDASQPARLGCSSRAGTVHGAYSPLRRDGRRPAIPDGPAEGATRGQRLQHGSGAELVRRAERSRAREIERDTTSRRGCCLAVVASIAPSATRSGVGGIQATPDLEGPSRVPPEAGAGSLNATAGSMTYLSGGSLTRTRRDRSGVSGRLRASPSSLSGHLHHLARHSCARD